MRRLVLAVVAATALAAASGAGAQPASGDQCFLTRLLQGHTVGPDGHTLYFGVNGADVYQVTTSGPCLAHATANDPIVLRDRGLGKICHPLDLELTVRGTRCTVEKLTKLTPQEIAALPKRLQP
ncbi:hypothetical protein [Phenylobacterium sp.]|jgi:hypothetical protein|uniref:hypothetical protein n=1 Tax=Phenylobacterium sp. TaxID=1871053 RepID=UPI002F3F61A1